MTDQRLLADRRRAVIVQKLRREGVVRVADLAEAFTVSMVTVRRDLDVLAREGGVTRIHGGALTAAPGPEKGHGETLDTDQLSAAKEAIAAAAAALVAPGSVVAISGGSTASAVAARLLDMPQLTVVTNSLAVGAQRWAAASAGRPDGSALILTGGSPMSHGVLVGALAEQSVRSLHVDLLILGTHGAAERTGLTVPYLAEARTNRALIASARRVAVVADRTKWGVADGCSFADLNEVDWYITDDAIPAEARDVLADNAVNLIVASTRVK